MVWMVDVALTDQVALWVRNNDQLWPNPANFACDSFANFRRGAQKAIFFAHEKHLLNATKRSGGALFNLAHLN